MVLRQETAEDIAATLSVVDLFLDPCAQPSRLQAQLTWSHNVHAVVPCPHMYTSAWESHSLCASLHSPPPFCIDIDVGYQRQQLTAAVLAPAAQRYQALQPKRQQLVAMVCYYGKHYMAFVLVRFMSCCCSACKASYPADHWQLALCYRECV